MNGNATGALLEVALPPKAHLTRLPQLHSMIVPVANPGDTLTFFAQASAALGEGVLWAQPESGIAFAGAGVAEALVFQGGQRFVEASEAVRALRGRVVRQDDSLFPLLGGFAFDTAGSRDDEWQAFPDGRLVIPQVLLQVTPGGTHLRVTLPAVTDTSDTSLDVAMRAMLTRALGWISSPSMMCVPGHAQSTIVPEDRLEWERQVSRAIVEIRSGAMSKVVLARAERLTAESDISAEAALGCLREEHAGATMFAFTGGDACFIGATPERLVRLRDGQVDVTCLAGTAAVGSTLEETAEFGRQLLASAKDRREHEIVVESTIDALQVGCSRVTRAAGTPRLRQARSVQHLETPLSASARPSTDIVQLAGLLHPTPAVGGFPAAPALELIRDLETFDRGWYAGPVGWVDLGGSGEFSVGIRSALLQGNSAIAYAGCGIVANSEPAAEFTETELKLRPMLAALGEA